MHRHRVLTLGVSGHNRTSQRPNAPWLGRAAKMMQVALAAGIVWLSVGCVTSDFAYLTDKRYPARGLADPIEVLEHAPTRSHVRLGNANVGMGVGHEEQRCLDELKKQAREVGGDAIGDYTYFMAPPGTVNAGNARCSAAVYRWQ